MPTEIRSCQQAIALRKIAPNHGWRHTFETTGREAGIERTAWWTPICGHAPSSVGGAYGGVSIAAQRRAFERFPRFEVEGLIGRGVSGVERSGAR
jgi:hypothetical protein